MSRYGSEDSSAKAIGSLVLIVILIIFFVWFYSASESGIGVVQSKWTETHTSCNDDGCTTSTKYLVQCKDGKIFGVFWGTRDWDRMIVGSTIKYEARGRSLDFFGWRLMQPDIFSFELLEGPPR
ncbi:hypothetical protein HY947_02370 [Candidatus Gottesmanbacteria bacterium]|nr:hypothetical protein [Candidatus Gottesmanbacteria bacterium]